MAKNQSKAIKNEISLSLFQQPEIQFNKMDLGFGLKFKAITKISLNVFSNSQMQFNKIVLELGKKFNIITKISLNVFLNN